MGDRFGVRSEPVVLRDYATLLAHLAPAPVVARLSRLVGSADPEGEVGVAAYLAEHGAPVVPPSNLLPPGPHEEDGFVFSFWDFAPRVDAPVDGWWAGSSLRELHDLLRGYSGDVRPFEPWDEVEMLLDRRNPGSDVDFLRDLARELRAELDSRTFRVQPLHGDGHLGNIVPTARGPLWTDFEIVRRGPVEWDLSCLISRRYEYDEPAPEIDAALAGYGGHDRALLELLAPIRLLYVTVWTLDIAHRRADAEPHARRRIERLRRAAA